MELTTVRLPEELARELDRIAEDRRVTRSELVRDALEHYCRGLLERGPGDRLTLVRHLVTYPGSGKGDLSTRGEQYLRERSRARRRRRSG